MNIFGCQVNRNLLDPINCNLLDLPNWQFAHQFCPEEILEFWKQIGSGSSGVLAGRPFLQLLPLHIC